LPSDDNIELEGTVVDSFRGGRFSVELENGHLVNCYLSGKMRKNYIKIIPGDCVTVSLSPYDLDNGRITWRHAPKKHKQDSSVGSQSSESFGPAMEVSSQPYNSDD